MYDGAQLANALVRRPDDVEAALATYERELFVRSRQAADLSAQNLAKFFGNDAPASVAALFRGAGSG